MQESVQFPGGRLLRGMAVLGVLMCGPATGAQQSDPLEVEQNEKVEVRLVILDAVVVDRNGRTVPDLTRDDFEILVDGRPRPIDTLDIDCPGGMQEAPRGLSRPERRPPIEAPEDGRRIVLAIDYLHLGGLLTVDVLEHAKRMMRKMAGDGEEIMVVALNGGLRVEQKFTSDRQEIWDSLHRMEYDISLWGQDYSHGNELGLFGGLQALMDLLEQVPGSKAIVFFSTVDLPADMNDSLYARLAGGSVSSRTSIYTVQADGLKPPDMGTTRADGTMETLPIGGSAMMDRLAADTGGAYLRGTNDLSLGYATAQRDLGCRYAVGFYDEQVEFDRSRQIELRVKRPGLRAIHPSNYRFRSPEAKRKSMLMSAFIAPEMFENGVVRTHIFPVRPRKPRLWETVVAVSFPMPVGGRHGDDATHEFGAVVKEGNRVVHQFSWSVTLRPAESGVEARPMVTFLEPLDLKPGRYHVFAVVSALGGDEATSATAEFELPAPTAKNYIVDPILWRLAGNNVVIARDEGSVSREPGRETGMGARLQGYEPLLVQQSSKDEGLHVMTQFCTSNSRDTRNVEAIQRRLTTKDGLPVGSLPDVPLDLEKMGKVRCQGLWDELPADSLEPGDYRFEARVEIGKPSDALTGRLRFAVDQESRDERGPAGQ